MIVKELVEKHGTNNAFQIAIQNNIKLVYEPLGKYMDTTIKSMVKNLFISVMMFLGIIGNLRSDIYFFMR
ncbi:hypothetical protein A9CBEGH2_07680 [Amedibacterium intestinale]|nr:hypothetical protein A9CBEGH2_07680 [Amedibacterium intestinale]